MSLILNGQPGDAIAILEPLSKQPGASKKVRQNLALAYGLKGYIEKALTLDRQDLTPEQAQANESFYKQYIESMQKKKSGEPAQPVESKGKESKTSSNVTPTQAAELIDVFEGSPMPSKN